MLATFDGPARALHCAAAIRRLASREGLQIRAGVHVGEVELVGEDVRGVTVHEAARIMAAAGRGRDPRLRPDPRARRRSGAPLRGSRDARAQGARRRVAPGGVHSGAMSELPLILAVDEDAEALERITGELQRYARDYAVICGPSTEAALAQLEALHERRRGGRDRAGRARDAGRSRARSSSSACTTCIRTRSGRSSSRGAAGRTRRRPSAIRTAMALGHIDYYALKPWSTPDELFHRLVSEFLAGVAAPERPGPARAHRRRRSLVAARVRAAEPPRAQRRAARVPHAATPTEGIELPPLVRPGRRGRSGRAPPGRHAARRSEARGPRAARDAHAHRDRRRPDRSTS